MDWKKIRRRDDIVGGQIEFNIDRDRYHGEIERLSEVRDDDGAELIIFHFTWCAILTSQKRWEFTSIRECSLHKGYSTLVIDDGVIYFSETRKNPEGKIIPAKHPARINPVADLLSI